LNKTKSKKGRRQQPETYIREGSEEAVDLLSQNAFSKVTTQKPLSRAEQNHRAAKFASRASTFKSTRQGRMIFEEPQNGSKGKSHEDKVEYNAYEEAHESRDMAKRGFRDRVKFSNKRSRQDAVGFEGDVEMTDAYAEQKAPPPAKKKKVKFDGRKSGAFQYRRPI
jgi:ribosomal RNA-processing protein 12